MELDVEAEVEKRFEMARREIEESRNLDSSRSNQKIGSSFGGKPKSVSFEPSVHSRFTKPTTASTERTKVNIGVLEEESITESIQIAESYQQSMRSQSAAEITASKPKGDHSGSSRKQKDAMQASQDKLRHPEVWAHCLLLDQVFFVIISGRSSKLY